MEMIKDLILTKDKNLGRKATLHIVKDNGKFSVINDILSGKVVFTANTIKECEDWYFNRLISGFTKVNC